MTSFDDHAGYGAVTSDEGRELFFHCTAVADGSRRIDQGVTVSYVVVAGRRGRWEASDLRPA